MDRTQNQPAEENHKRMNFPSVHLTLEEFELLEDSWNLFLQTEATDKHKDHCKVSTLITKTVQECFSSSFDKKLESFGLNEVPIGIDINTVCIMQALAMQINLLTPLELLTLDGRKMIFHVWALSRLFYREFLRIKGIKPQGS